MCCKENFIFVVISLPYLSGGEQAAHAGPTHASGLTRSKADIRNPLRYLLMNAVASRSVSGSFQLPLT